MRLLHKITLEVFAKPEEDVQAIKQALVELVPLNLEEEKIQLQDKQAKGFNERMIHVFTIILSKESHTNAFLKFFLKKLSAEQKEFLLRQKESRIDKDLNFFIRLDKENWLKERVFWITDNGDCFHLKFMLAVFPKKRDVALELIDKTFA